MAAWFSQALGILLAVALLSACKTPPAPSDPAPTDAPATPGPLSGPITLTFGTEAADSDFDVGEIQVIDPGANLLRAFTTTDTALNLSGWSAPRTDPAGVAYRGGEDGAAITIPVPDGAEGLLLNARSGRGPAQVAVTLNGETLARLHLTDEWRLHYVPLNSAPAVTPSTFALDWDVRGYFPVFPAAQRTYAFRVRSALEDWWGAPTDAEWRVSDSHETVEALTLTSLQGVVNRADPSIYLDWEDQGLQGDASRFWLGPLSEHIEIVYFDIEESSAVSFLLRRYADHFTGAVIYDPDIPDTINLATALAGLEDRVMLAPQQLEHPEVQAFLARHDTDSPNPHGLPTLASHPAAIDLRALAAEQGWETTSKLAQYQWLYDTLWPELEQRGIGILSPGPPTSELSAVERGVYDPLGLAARDYMIALRMPVLWLSPTVASERVLFERFLEEAPSPIPVFSFYDGQENDTVDLASSYGNWVPVIPNSNTPLSAGNLSLLTAVRPEVIRYARAPDEEAILSTLGQAPVVTLWNSDGDAMQILYDRGIPGGVQFMWENLNEVPFGFSINPILADLTPLVWNYFQSTANGPSFISALSGAGYSSPQLMDDDELAAYLETSSYYFELTGLRSIYMIELRGAFDGDLAAAYVDALEPYGYLGAYATFLGGPQGEVTLSYPDDPHPVIRPRYVLAPGRGEGIKDQILAGEPGELTFNLAGSNMHQGRVIADPDAYSGQAVLFERESVPNCCMAVSGGNLSLTPGDYTVTFRLKLPAKNGSGQIGLVQVLQQSGGGVVHASQPVYLSDFATAGEYRDFTLQFTLEQLTEHLELWIDYLGDEPGFAAGDLVADRIVVERAGGFVLPRFDAIFIGLVGPIDSMDEDIRIMTEDFAAEGGIVLHPDDFAAALNPAFMLALAEERLGAQHPSLDAPRAALADGAYYEALLLVRQALQEELGE